YQAFLNDLGVRKLRISLDWDVVEPEKGKYDFSDIDWQVVQAEKKGAKLILAIGMKTPRWPECHQPKWVDFSQPEAGDYLLTYLKKVIERYKNSPAVFAWQIENEPFFPFGKCPKFDKELFKKEVLLARSVDPKRPIIVSDSGEYSLWFKAARYGDIVGITMYKKVWLDNFHAYFNYFFPPVFYQRKAILVNKIFHKKVICLELQAEPWGPRLIYDNLPLEEQEKTMNLDQFRKNIKFARDTGLDTFYLWGGEWWYWLKIKQNQPQIWNEAKKLF
ncbi:MAG TPA: hypothetical protein ENL27_01445, partial [Candidatus Parcubacteria bacterium]|nr:hypothetical protein [Candidatus Parcubacteria bacterium]